MITKEEFKELIESHREQNKLIDKLCEVFPASYGDPIIDWGCQMFTKVLKAYFTEEGVDWIEWWIYERDDNPEMKAWDKDSKEIPLDTVDDLWNLVEKYIR